jgi:ABC-2 type transport system ATP-binding protein
MATEDHIRITDLARSFGSLQAVRGISLKIEAGETFGLLGPNGAGKTTTLSMLSTLLAPSRGDVRVFGASIVEAPGEVRRLVGLAPQQISLYPKLTAQENLEFFGRLHGLVARALHQRVDRVLELVGLESRRDDLVYTYSGGMQRRLNLGCSLIHEPRLLLLDEPTAGVDPQSREHLFEALEQISSSGTTVIYTTHYIEEAERMCDRIAIIDEGRIAAMGTLQELLGLIGMGEVIEIRSGAIAMDGRALQSLPEVVKVERGGDVLRLFVENAARAINPIARAVEQAGGELESLEVYPVSLERVFLHVTGKELRD